MSHTTEALRLKRTIRAPRQKVFDAWIKPELRKRWWRATPQMFCDLCEIDARPGGRYRTIMKGPKPDGCAQDEAAEYVTVGQFIEVVEPEKLVFTWRWETWRESHEDSVVTVELREVAPNVTELTLTHERLPDANAVKEHGEGWSGCLDIFAAFMAG